MATPVSGVNRWLTLNDEPLLFDAGSENLDAGAQEYQYSHFRITEEAPDDLEIRIEGELLQTERYGRWIWYPEAFAGLYNVDVSAPGHGNYRTQIRVLPGNITLRQQEQMLEDIAKISADLLFQLQSPGREHAGIALADDYQSPLRSYRLVDNLMGDLEKAMALIARTPHRVLAGRLERRQWHEPAVVGANAAAVPGPVVAVPNVRPGIPDVWPCEWQVERGELTYDIYENRLLKHFLWSQLLPRLIQVEDGAGEEIRRRRQKLVICEKYRWRDNAAEEAARIAELEDVANSVRSLQRRVIRWGNLPFLRWVRLSPLRAVPTQVLQKDPGYNQFYSVYLRFQHELRRGVTAERFLTQMALRKMAELYEMWAVFRITDALLPLLRKAGYQVVSERGFFRLEDQLFHFEVDRDAAIELTRGETRVFIRYEPLYPHLKKGVEGLGTTRYPWLTPDLAVERWEDGIPQAIVIFDPKYKSQERGGRRTCWDRDLDKMSTYYSEILWKAPGKDNRPEQIVASAYILYPGEVLVHNEDYPRIGALPVVPERKQRQDVRPVLVDLLRNGGLMNGGDK
jgi:hypothetical protein